MPTPRVEEKGVGLGWGCLRWVSGGWTLVFTFIGFVVLLGTRVWPLALLFAFFLAVLWVIVTRNFRWQWGLFMGAVVVLFASVLLVVIGYLIHPHQVVPGR